MANVLTSRIGKGKRLHIVSDDLKGSLCGRELDALEHKTQVTSYTSKRICISCRCAKREGK